MKFIFLSFLFLTSFKNSPWVYKDISRCKTATQPAMIYYATESQFNGLQLKFLRNDFGTKGYLSIFGNDSLIKKSKITPLIYSIDGVEFRDTAIVLEGKQTLLLSENTTKELLKALTVGKVCKILHNGSYRTIPSTNFSKKCKKFSY